MSYLRLIAFFIALISSLPIFAQELIFGSVSLEDTYSSNLSGVKVVGSGISISSGKLLSQGQGYIEYPANSKISGVSSLIVDLSVKFNSLNDLVRVVYLKGSYHIDIRNNYIRMNVFTDQGSYALTLNNMTPDLSKEYRISMMLNKGELLGFIDGKLIGKIAAPGTIVSSTSGLSVAGTSGKYLFGTVDNLKIGSVGTSTTGGTTGSTTGGTTGSTTGGTTGSSEPSFGSVSLEDTYSSNLSGVKVVGSGISISSGKLLSQGQGYIEYPANSKISGVSNLIVDLSVKFTSLNDLVRLVYLQGSYHIDIRNNYIRMNVFTDQGSYALTLNNMTPDLSKEYRISMMLNKGELQGFIDGKLIGKIAAPGTIVSSTSGLFVAGTSGKYLFGTVDNLKIGSVGTSTTGGTTGSTTSGTTGSTTGGTTGSTTSGTTGSTTSGATGSTTGGATGSTTGGATGSTTGGTTGTPPVSGGNGCDCGSTNPAAPCTGTSITHTRTSLLFPSSTIQFEFQCDGGACACGKFANQYDYWVAPRTANGVVRIVKMTPATVGAADATLRNGWVANPSSVIASSFMDGRLGKDMSATGKPLNPSTASPFSITTSSAPVTTIVKSHSMLETGANCSSGDANVSRHCFWQAAVLTVLNKVPDNAGSTVLRPPMTGTEKPLHSVSLINFAALPNLPYPVRKDGTVVTGPTWGEAIDLMGPPKVEWGTSGNYVFWQYMPPLYNFSISDSGYPPRSLGGLLEAIQLIAIDGKGFEAQKKLLTIQSVQWGLDYYYMWKSRGFGRMYESNGGHAVGRYLPTVVAAALMTGTVGTEMKNNMLRVNNGTPDKCGFDVSTELHYWPTTKRTLYGYFSIPGCDGFGSYLTQTNANYVDPGYMSDNGRLAVNAHNDATDVNSCAGAYQPITAGPTQATANLIRAIPAARAIAATVLIPYIDRLVANGYYCRKDHTPAATYDSAFGKCAAGVNQGEECLLPRQCPGSTCVGHNHQYSSWLARNMWAKYKDCYDTKTCPGMSGIK